MSDQGGSFLAEAAASAPVDGTPAGAGQQSAPPANGAEQAVREAQDGPPEWAPKKYWDAEKREVNYQEMGRGYQNLEKLLGREKVPLPTDDDDQDGWNRWYAASGRPEKPEDYQFQSPELPADLPYDTETEKTFRTWAHVNGLSKKQATNLFDGYVKHQIERHAGWAQAQKQQQQELQTALQREYGNKLESVKQTAGTVMREINDPEFNKYLEESGLGNDPRMIRAFYKLGQKLNGETKLKGAVQQAPAAPQDYQKAIADFRDKHKDALHDRDHPNHAMRVKEFNQLFEGAYGKDPANRF